MKFQKLDSFDFNLQLDEQTHSLAYRVAPNVVIARNPVEGAPSDDWQLIHEPQGHRIQGGFRTRKGAYEAWLLICEIAEHDPTEGVPEDPTDAVEILRAAIMKIRGYGATKPADLDWRFAA